MPKNRQTMSPAFRWNYSDERKKVLAGKSISYQVSTIENDLIDSQAAALRAKADYLQARASYYRAIGTLLDRRGVLVEREGAN